MITSPFLVGRDRYERVMEGWVDNTHEDAFTHTVRSPTTTPAVELDAVCTPSPGYEVREAAAHASWRARRIPRSWTRSASLGGARMVAGFTRRLADLCGGRAAAAALRRRGHRGRAAGTAGRQACRREAMAGFQPGDARRCWELDTHGLGRSARLLLHLQRRRPCAPRHAPGLHADGGGTLQRQPVGARGSSSGGSGHASCGRLPAPSLSLHARQRARLRPPLRARSGRPGAIVAADSITSRLPYPGICTEPQGKIAAMIGQTCGRPASQAHPGRAGRDERAAPSSTT